jgi:hypothetical protein
MTNGGRNPADEARQTRNAHRLAQLPFEEKIRKVGELIQLSRKSKLMFAAAPQPEATAEKKPWKLTRRTSGELGILVIIDASHAIELLCLRIFCHFHVLSLR